MRIRSAERAAYWRGVLARQTASGLCVAAFCREESVSPPSFYAWRRKLQAPDAGKAQGGEAACKLVTSPSGFVPVRIASAESAGALHVRWPDGLSLEAPAGADSTTISSVIGALHERYGKGALTC